MLAIFFVGTLLMIGLVHGQLNKRKSVNKCIKGKREIIKKIIKL